MRESTEFLILDTIKRNSSIMPLFGIDRWKIIKKKKNNFTILPLNSYKVKKKDIDEIYLP